MSSEYMPKVGDRVRATLGENVLVGNVRHANSEILRFDIGDPSNYYVSIGLDDGWQFEHVVELPTKLGAIVKATGGQKFVRWSVGADDYPWVKLDDPLDDTHSSELVAENGFTVLFEGVDE